MNGHRQLGTVKEALLRHEEGKSLYTCEITFSFDDGAPSQVFVQALGPDQHEGFVRSLCEALGVSGLSDLVGKKLYALRHWPEDVISGLETLESKRFSCWGWVKSMSSESLVAPRHPLENRKKYLEHLLGVAKSDIAMLESEIATLEERFCDWEED